MTDFRRAFVKRLLDAAPLAALVDDRVEFVRRNEGDPLPALVVNVISDVRPLHYKGEQGLRESRIQVDVFAETLGEALSIADLAIAAVADPTTVQDPGGPDVRFERATIEGPETSGSQEASLYVNRARFDALVWHCTT